MEKNKKRTNAGELTPNEPMNKLARNKTNNGSLDDVFDKDIRPYIDIIDAMRKYGLEQDVPLPNVVVVGDQSSGKSSIIEIISGIQLPRGTGIVTRCPLELQLKKVSNQAWQSIISYKTVAGKEVKKKIYNLEEVEKYISDAQNDLCGPMKGVSKELITLRVESPEVTAPDLTLIDLPGIARTAVENQPKDTCENIRKMIMEHVEKKNTVILCVISGDLDIAVNESISIAQKVDPFGLRTIGVITKPDIADVDHKREVLKMMDNKKIFLKKGYNLVKCRSSEQLKNNVPLSTFLENELDFYQKDDIYKLAKKSQVGARNLSKKITIELVNVIKDTLPKLRISIDELLEKANTALNEMPQNIPENDKDKRTYIINIGSDLNTKLYNFLIAGKLFEDRNYHNIWRLNFEKFKTAIGKKMDNAFENELSIDNLQLEIKKCRGKEISGFLSYTLFESLVKNHIESYKKHADNVQSEMGKIIKRDLDRLFDESFSYLPTIEKDLKKILNSEFTKILNITQERIEFIFKQEKVVFTMDDEFDKMWKDNEKFLKDEEKSSSFGGVPHSTIDNARRMSTHIKSYLKIVHTRLSDSIPTAIMQCLLFQMHDNLIDKILEYVSRDEIIGNIKECPEKNEDRKSLMDQIERLKKGKMELENF